MFLLVAKCLLLALLWIPSQCRLQEHRQFQYKSMPDGSGTYNFAYDTSHQPSDAHSLHMEYRDANGVVRGRYGYTDPRGNLRVVEYEAGPDGYKARGDVGPDLFPHMEAPGLSPQKPVPVSAPLRMAEWDSETNPVNQNVVTGSEYYTSYSPSVEESPELTPLRMAGWDPEKNPINQRVVTSSEHYTSYSPTVKKARRGYVRYTNQNTAHVHRPSYVSQRKVSDPEVEVFQLPNVVTTSKKSKPLIRNEPLTIYNIDVDPDEIRVAGPPASIESRSPASSSTYVTPRRNTEITVTSPEIVYYPRSSRRRTGHIHNYDDSYPAQSVSYYTYGSRIQKPRQIGYRTKPHYHDQRYYFE